MLAVWPLLFRAYLTSSKFVFFYISTTIQNAVKPRCSPRADLGWCFPHAPFTLNSHPDALSYLMLPGLLFPKNWERIPYRLGNPPGYSMHRTMCSLLLTMEGHDETRRGSGLSTS